MNFTPFRVQGARTAIFTRPMVERALLLRPIGVPSPKRLTSHAVNAWRTDIGALRARPFAMIHRLMKCPRRTLPLAVFALVTAPAATLLAADPQPALTIDLGGGQSLPMVLVPNGAFTQGSPPGEPGRKDDETPRRVTLSYDFYLGKTPVTVGQFARFVAATGYRTEAEAGTSGGSGWDGHALTQRKEFNWSHPGFPQQDDHPVTLVTYGDARAFASWASRVSGRTVDLPTEAQWEYAYRAGGSGAYYAGEGDKAALTLGWFKPNAGAGTHPVAKNTPNNFGLYDMAGNVAEWCRDWYAPYGPDGAIDPEVTTPGSEATPRRVLRGGSWLKDTKNGRAAARYQNSPGSRNADNGFRVAASINALSTLAPVDTGPPRVSPPEPVVTEPHRSSGLGAIGVFELFFVGIVGIVGIVIAVAVIRWLARLGNARPRLPFAQPQVRVRSGADGFWIDAPPHLRGATLRYRHGVPSEGYRAPPVMREDTVVIEPSPSGQFVYTGYAPIAVEVLEVIGAPAPGPGYAGGPRHVSGRWPSSSSSSPFPSRSRSSHHVHEGAPQPFFSSSNEPERKSDPPPFRGFPSAY